MNRKNSLIYQTLIQDFEKHLGQAIRRKLDLTLIKINNCLIHINNTTYDLEKIDALDSLVKYYVDGLREINVRYNLSAWSNSAIYVRSYGQLVDAGVDDSFHDVDFIAYLGINQANLELAPSVPFSLTIKLYEWALQKKLFPTPNDFKISFQPIPDAHIDPMYQRKNLQLEIRV